MSPSNFHFQPGAILHDAIAGAFKARGSGFEIWCRENNITPSLARQATFGQSRGPKGKAMLARLIEAAGPDFVKLVYSQRIAESAEAIKKGAA